MEEADYPKLEKDETAIESVCKHVENRQSQRGKGMANNTRKPYIIDAKYKIQMGLGLQIPFYIMDRF